MKTKTNFTDALIESIVVEALPAYKLDNYSLSVNQEKFFKNSVVRDSNNNLLPVYHGTETGGFSEFNSGIKFNSKEAFIWFSADLNHAKEYMGWEDDFDDEFEDEFEYKPQMYEVFLNITKPVILTRLDTEAFYQDNKPTKELLAIASALSTSPQERLNIYKKLIEIAKVVLKRDYVISGFSDMQVFDIVKNPEFRELLLHYKPNCDGIICSDNSGATTTYGVLYPNQIKAINNLNPTNSNNIYK